MTKVIRKRRELPGHGKDYMKNQLWSDKKEQTSDETAILWEGPDDKDVITDLFGERVKIINIHQDDEAKANVTVATKVTQEEYDKIKQMAERFGISMFKYLRGCIRKQLEEHELMMEPNHY